MNNQDESRVTWADAEFTLVLLASSNAIIPLEICSSDVSDGSYLSCCEPDR